MRRSVGGLVSTEASLLAPETVVGGYQVDAPLAPGSTSFLGTEVATGRKVVLFEASQVEGASVEPATRLSHQHFAALLDVLEQPSGTSVVVYEHVPGETLSARLEVVGKKTPVDAVRSALRIAQALSVLHDAGGAHGSVRPETVVIAPVDRAAPVILFASSKAGPFRSPDRGELGPPSSTDDSWAAAAILYVMLTGALPPSTGVTASDLEAAGVTDEALKLALEHGLSGDPARRSDSIVTMKRELARWFVDHAGDEDPPIPPSQVPSKPPPLPPGASSSPPPPSGVAPMSGVAASTRPPPARSSKSLVAGLAIGALVFGLGGAWLFSSIRSKPKIVEVPIAASAPVASSQEVDLAAVPVTGSKETSNCVAGLLPKDAFKQAPDLEWVCKVADPREGASRLKVELVKSAAGNITDATKIWSQLGWYEIAVYATVFSGCCSGGESMSFPEPAPGCTGFDKVAKDLGIAIADNADHTAQFEAFKAVVECEAKANRATTFRQKGPSSATEAEAFASYVKSIQP